MGRGPLEGPVPQLQGNTRKLSSVNCHSLCLFIISNSPLVMCKCVGWVITREPHFFFFYLHGVWCIPVAGSTPHTPVPHPTARTGTPERAEMLAGARRGQRCPGLGGGPGGSPARRRGRQPDPPRSCSPRPGAGRDTHTLSAPTIRAAHLLLG